MKITLTWWQKWNILKTYSFNKMLFLDCEKNVTKCQSLAKIMVSIKSDPFKFLYTHCFEKF